MATYGGEGGEVNEAQSETTKMIVREELNEAMHDLSIGPVRRRVEKANDIEAEYQQKCGDLQQTIPEIDNSLITAPEYSRAVLKKQEYVPEQ